MSELLKNTAGQRIGFSVVDAATGAAKTSGVSVTLTLDGGTQTASAGTLTHEGNGHYTYDFTQSETNADHIYLGWHGTDVVPGGVNLYTTTKRVRDLQDYAGADTAGTTTLLARLTSTRAGNLDNLDVAISTRLADADYTDPPTATAIADAALGRSVSSVEATAGPFSLAGLILLVTNSDTTTNAGAVTAFRVDGTTEFAQYTITADAAAEAITSIKG